MCLPFLTMSKHKMPKRTQKCCLNVLAEGFGPKQICFMSLKQMNVERFYCLYEPIVSNHDAFNCLFLE